MNVDLFYSVFCFDVPNGLNIVASSAENYPSLRRFSGSAVATMALSRNVLMSADRSYRLG